MEEGHAVAQEATEFGASHFSYHGGWKWAATEVAQPSGNLGITVVDVFARSVVHVEVEPKIFDRLTRMHRFQRQLAVQSQVCDQELMMSGLGRVEAGFSGAIVRLLRVAVDPVVL